MPLDNSAPYERQGRTRKIHIRNADGDLKVYVLLELHDGKVSGISIKADREGSTIHGLLDALGSTATAALAHGVPLEVIVQAWSRLQFEPAGTTTDPAMRQVSSIPDAVARYLAARYLPTGG
jgi:hypothetical protein